MIDIQRQTSSLALPLYEREKLSTRNTSHIKTWNTALTHLPLGLGKAYSQNDCFFDAIAQALPIDKLQEYKLLLDVKSLRTICSEEANKIHQADTQNNWIKNWDTWGTSDVTYETYLSYIQYAAHEAGSNNIKDTDILRGDPDIDGRLLCAHFNITLHVMGWDESTDQITHKILSNDLDNPIDSVEKHEVDYTDDNLVHIAHYKDHFVPLVKGGEKTIQQIKNCEIPKQKDATPYNRFSQKNNSTSTLPETNKLKEKKVEVSDDHEKKSCSATPESKEFPDSYGGPPVTPSIPKSKAKAYSNFIKFWQANSNATSRFPHILLPIPISIGLTYLVSLAYDATTCGTTSIDSVNNFFNSKLQDASSFAEGLKTPGVIYGLATMFAVAVCVGACWYNRKKQNSLGFAGIPGEHSLGNT